MGAAGIQKDAVPAWLGSVVGAVLAAYQNARKTAPPDIPEPENQEWIRFTAEHPQSGAHATTRQGWGRNSGSNDFTNLLFALYIPALIARNPP